MGTKRRKIILWDTYGCTTTEYVLTRFQEEGHGEVFADERPFPAPRASYLLNEFIEGKTGANLFLVQTRDMLVADLIALLAAQNGVRTYILPEMPVLTTWKKGPHKGKKRVMSHPETFDTIIKHLDKATRYEVAERQEKEE